MGFVFGEICSISFFVSCDVRKHGCVKTSRKYITFLITSLSKSKFSVITYVSCFLEIIQCFSIFVMYQSMVADRSSI